MKIIEYFTSDNQSHWLKEIQKSDWEAGQYLFTLLRDGKLKDLVGQTALVPMLIEEETQKLVSFCTFAPLDDIQPTQLTPWIGFVYTFPEYRGHRYAGKLMAFAESLATIMGKEAVYISTGHTGLYEKYGYEFYQILKDVGGEDSRVYRKALQMEGKEKAARMDQGGRWKAEIVSAAKKDLDMTAVCGFSCKHCFLGQWCGGCRSVFCCCSYGTLFPGEKCPNVACCEEKGLDGCYACEQMETCNVGLYTPDNDGAAASKAQAMFLRKYGKGALFQVHDRLHETYDFEKTQEILGQAVEEGLRILEECWHFLEKK
ncbi:MAG: GNAT family N-acetyltransferase [Faecousia sp.]